MSRHLCLSATLLTGRYHADEWPPSPARTFQALLAGVMTGGYRVHQSRAEETLRWLETLPPPDIIAVPKQDPQQAYRLAVPNNDFDSIAHEWAKGRPADPARLRTMKEVVPKLLTDDSPPVRYLWDVTQQPQADAERHASTLKTVAHCLHTLGWGVDMAFADANLLDNLEDISSLPGERWVHGKTGKLLAVPIPGLLDDLKECYGRFTKRTHGAGVNPDTRPSVLGSERYARAGEVVRPCVAFKLLVPETDRLYSRGAHESMRVAAWLRHATAEALRGRFDSQWINEYILGHVENGDRSNRLSYVPLPSVGHRHVNGRIRRVMIVEPHEASGDVTRLLRHALRGVPLIAEETSNRVCSLALANDDDTVISQYWKVSTKWRSVTPIVLHGFNMQRGRLSLRITEKLLLQAFTNSGYPSDCIRSIYFQPSPLIPGSVAARDVLVPKHLAQWPRYHVAVEFTKSIRGPILAGIGRHYGLGLFIPG